MTEDFLFYIWKFSLFKNSLLKTTNNENILVLNQGTLNHDAGPDFFNAKIKINDTTWAGNIEIHTNASDWFKHNHHKDPAYDNVILHVVYNADTVIHRENNKEIPTLELKGLIPEQIYDNYLDIINNKGWISCQNQLDDIDDFILKNWLDRLLVERLERKSISIQKTLQKNNNNWEETFYQCLARNFGFKVNDVPFELLAKSLPQKCLAKHKNNLFQVEAMLMGQAGFLNQDFEEDFPRLLKKEYLFLKNKFSLQPIESHLWKFMRIRPSNFPTIRISQFADLVSKSSGLFSLVLETKTIEELRKIFNVTASAYWDTHYNFGKTTARKKKKNLGKTAVDNLVINTIVPFYFVYSNAKQDESYKDRALEFLASTKKEQNNIIRKWENLGIEVLNAYESQALIQLKTVYCNHKKCLDCAIGNRLIRDTNG